MPERGPLRVGEPAVEGADIHPWRVLVAAGVIAVALVLVVLSVGGLLRWWDVPADVGPNAPRGFEAQRPRLESAPQEDRAAYAADQAARLNAYGWADRRAGRAHIPIDVAMSLLAADATAARRAADLAPAGKTVERKRGGRQ